jgi:hypothetical protein
MATLIGTTRLCPKSTADRSVMIGAALRRNVRFTVCSPFGSQDTFLLIVMVPDNFLT